LNLPDPDRDVWYLDISNKGSTSVD